ncbi:MAG: hypothetical protein CMJ72_03765 [Planctomycetaceae bacterium]|nr:hypothetical protein [Planctomycetaceae bacterium]
MSQVLRHVAMYVVLSALLVHSCGYAQTGVVTGDDHDARNPYISSLRCNLQRKHIERLIDMSMPSNGFGSAAAPVQEAQYIYNSNEMGGGGTTSPGRRGPRMEALPLR